MTDWFSLIKRAKKSCIVDHNLKKIHYDFGDNREMVEEYNLTTKLLNRRAWRMKNELKGEPKWEVELGDPEPIYNCVDKCMIRENADQPFICKRNTKLNLEWRIRNLPYPLEVYSVTADQDSQQLIVRTTNKKYYKRLDVPDLQRLGIDLVQANVAFSHRYNTLIITYKKPKQLLDFEKNMLEVIKGIEPQKYGEGLNDCKPS
ncbi:protein DPCD [Cylas formicarius]|uniref:protein DPCD n=1 Tax=Cylas formicarius TaxID=197179 RepID=UPI00295851A5|nr:protein DPCD [Cylas formicarius]